MANTQTLQSSTPSTNTLSQQGSAPKSAANRPATRAVTATYRATPTSDGAGVRLNRSIGTRALPELDPFLLLDEFRSDQASDYLAGFPEHPHRGFETVTYMLAGRMRHGDNQGNSGLLKPGSVQWMTAGRGIVHSEMPEQENGLMWGFQLWVNLPAKDKMTAPRYQDIDPETIPVVGPQNGVTVKVVAGHYGGVDGAVKAIVTDPTYLDITLEPGASFTHALPDDHTAFVYVFDGAARVGADLVNRGELAVLGAGDTISIATADDKATRALLVAAKPLNEPVVRAGPFVMNTEEQLHQAFDDYRAGRF